MPTFHWIGKEKVVKHHHEGPFKTLRKEYAFTAPEGTPANSTGNRIIHGDNLEALKALLPEFEGRVKCIYNVCMSGVGVLPAKVKKRLYKASRRDIVIIRR